jgi:UPF0271 protein
MQTELDRKRIMVLDTSAFISGFDPFTIQASQFSVSEVRHELTPNSLPWTRFNTAVENGRLEVKTPKAEYVNKVEGSSKTVGDLLFLSQADKQVLALALELKNEGNRPQIVTDDYSIQNVANQLGIDFASLITFGIRYRFRWTLYCPACHRKYPADYRAKHCQICDTRLKRKPLRKSPLQSRIKAKNE